MTEPDPPATLMPPITAAASDVSSHPEASTTVTVPTRPAYSSPAKPHIIPLRAYAKSVTRSVRNPQNTLAAGFDPMA